MTHDNVVFIDTETTGLDPDRHEIWELALIDGTNEHVWHLPVDLAKADLIALNIGGYFERFGGHTRGEIKLIEEDSYGDETGWEQFVHDVMVLTKGKHLVGAIPSFDAQRIEKLLRKHGGIATWHYHLIDIEALAAGHLRAMQSQSNSPDEFDIAMQEVLALPWKSEELSLALGVDPADYQPKHSALADARWAKAVYEKVMG